ncbi:MAG TPA: hypothetical protein PLR96_01530, partial [Flavobacteriales bacterium]|nr:hypothetical protein [Flavobacteriales bacterium]
SEVVEPRELKRLHAHFLEHDDLGDFFTHEAFRKHHGPVQNHLLIRYFFERSAGSTDAGIRARLQRLPFIYGEGDMLRPPMEICFPSKAEATDLEKEVTVIHAAVYREIEAFPDILRWLEELGVSVVSELSWLENEVLPRLNSLNYKEHFLDLTMSICKLHKRGQLSASHIMDLSEFRLKCTNGSIRPARECYLSDVYLPELPLEDTVDRSIAGHGVHFVSREYLDELALDKGDLKSFFTAIQVKEDIKITCHSTPVHWPLAGSDEYRSYIHATYDNGTSNWPYHTGGAKSDSHAFVGHCDFAMLKHCVRSHRLAKLLFKHLITANGDEDTLRAIEKPSVLLHGFERDKRLAVPNYVKWSFQSSRCFPATDGEVYKAEDVYLNSPENVEIGGSLLPVFDHEERITNDWLKLFRFKEKIGLTDLLLVLGHLAQGADSGGKIRKQDIKRIGLVYTKLASEVPSFSSAQKSELNSWAQKNKVLTSDGDFALPSELKWVKEAGRKVPKGRIRTLVVPEECPTDAGFEQLLHDLGVEIIDTFNVNALDEREDTVLMERLKPLVPFLALVASIRQSEDLKEVLERIETRRKKLRLFQCTDLSLVFRAEGVEMPGELMQCHRDGNTIRYRGSWTSKSTLYELVPELARALDVPKLNMDLMRLLQSDLDEIGAFMEELGADVSALPNDVREAALMGLLTDVEDEENIPTSSKNHLAQNRKHEANREARDKVLKRLKERGYDITKADATHSVVNGVFKDGKEYPLVIKSYRNTSFKFNIRPNEWAQLDRENAMFWVHRGEGSLVVLQLADLLAANKEFHVQFETETFGRDGMAEFARAFRQRDGRFVRNVYFQLDAPDFRMEDALGEYRFNVRTEEKLEKGDDNEKLLH